MPGKSSTTEIRELERVTSKLKIVDADKEDAGRYSCQATNAFGTSHLTIDVNIWGREIFLSSFSRGKGKLNFDIFRATNIKPIIVLESYVVTFFH